MEIAKKVSSVIAFVALIVSIIAVYFAWQANKISMQANEIAMQANEIAASQAMPQIRVIDTKVTNFSGDICIHGLRLANLGGASTAIVGYEPKVSYGGSDLDARPMYTSETEDRLTILVTGLGYFQFWLTDEIPSDDLPPSQIKYNEFPMKIEAYNVSNYSLYAAFLEPSNREFAARPTLTPDILDTGGTVLSSVKIRLDLEMANGERIETPEIVCLFYRQKD